MSNSKLTVEMADTLIDMMQSMPHLEGGPVTDVSICYYCGTFKSDQLFMYEHACEDCVEGLQL